MADQRSDPHRLVLVRHAKAVGSSGGGDRNRPLTNKGRSDASSIGGWLDPLVAKVDAIWSSSALRARETTKGLAVHLHEAPEPYWRDDLYDAGSGDLLALLRSATEDLAVLVVVGHNPTIEAAYGKLTGDARGFRPGAAALVELEGPWSDAAGGTGRLLDFHAP